jgi:hypothetical protein
LLIKVIFLLIKVIFLLINGLMRKLAAWTAGSCLQQGDFAIAILQLIRTQDAGGGLRVALNMLQVPEPIGRGPPSPVESGLHQLRRRPPQLAPHRRADSTTR